MESQPAHECRFIRKRDWSPWVDTGPVRERDARRIDVCGECGRRRPTRSRRAPELIEREAALPVPPPDREPVAVAVAEVLRRRAAGGPCSARGVLGALRRRGVARSAAEEWLERFLSSGWVTLRWKTRGTRRELLRVDLRMADAIAEFARPGEMATRRAALDAAREAVSPATHPVAREVFDLLTEPDGVRLDARVVHALAAIAVHVDRGDVLAARAFSAQYLGDSKLLARLRRRLEALVGPLEALGIRDGTAMTLVGGAGRLNWEGCVLDLAAAGPFVGLASDAVTRLVGITLPANGVVVVENLTVFEACCRGEVDMGRGALVIWSGGYPGRAVRALVARAHDRRAPVRVWADLDVDGIRIARIIDAWTAGAAETHRMGVADVKRATVARPLSTRNRQRLADDLVANPDALLAETAQALLDRGEWIEQETMLGSTSRAIAPRL